MGSGITQVCAQSGYQVFVSETNDELLNKGLKSIDSFLAKGVEKGKISEQDKHLTFSRIKGTTRTENFSDCDLIIEAVSKNMDLKAEVFAKLDKVCHNHAVLPTNTSSLSIIHMAMGLHFFNPVPIMKLVEVVKTITTIDETLEIGKNFARSLGKAFAVAPDTPGFIVNHLLTPFALNAIRMLEAGIATRDDIDTVVTLGLNHPMGPLALSDLGGMDTNYFVAKAMYEELKDPQYAPPVLMKKMITAGWLGRKTGKGFYEYKK